MTRAEVIHILKIERECISRDCDRNCGYCDLVQEQETLLKVYDEAIRLLEQMEYGNKQIQFSLAK